MQFAELFKITIALATTRFLLNYIRYVFLTGSVLFSLTVLFFILISFFPDFVFPIPSLLEKVLGTDSFTLGIKEVMEVFAVVSLVMMLLSMMIRYVIRKVSGRTIEISYQKKNTLIFSSIILSYIIASTIILLRPDIDNSILFIFLFFFLLNMVSAIGYILMDSLLQRLKPIGWETGNS